MDISKLRKKTKKELIQRLNDKKEKLANLKYEITLGQENDYSQIKKLKKEIARIKSILKEESFKK